MKQALMVA